MINNICYYFYIIISFHTFGMKFQKCMFIGQFTLFCHLFLYEISSTEALVGNNVVPANFNEFPFIAAIIRRTQNFNPQSDFICTGTLITRKDILTAEHCFEDEYLEGLKVVIGSIDLLCPVNYYPNWWISYAYWGAIVGKTNGCSSNDISIARLTSDVSDTIPVAKLSFKTYENLMGKIVTTAGWGETNDEVFPTLLNTVKLQILSYPICKSQAYELSGENYSFDANLLCSAAQPYALFKGGDSGGPLVYHNKVVAVNTATFPNLETDFHPDKMNLHTNLYFYDEYYLDVISYL